MMNKKQERKRIELLALLVFFLLAVTVVSAVNYIGNTKAEIQQQLKDDKLELNNVMKNVTYTSDELCYLDFDTEEVYRCEVCFSVSNSTNILLESCIDTDETAKVNEVDNAVKDYIKFELEQKAKQNQYIYKKASFINKTMTVMAKT